MSAQDQLVLGVLCKLFLRGVIGRVRLRTPSYLHLVQRCSTF